MAAPPLQRWLLALGSSLPSDDRLQQALLRLGELGTVRALTPVRRCPSYDGRPGRWYFNALAELDCTLDHAALHTQLRAIEVALGRRRDVPGEVAIDLDILAGHVEDSWQADPHALAKGDLDHPITQTLLALAGIAAIRR